MRLSVIVPAFNEERYLPRSLSSVRQAALAFGDAFPGETIEVIVVDNGSTDQTATVAREHGAMVIPEGRRGIAVARNTGAAAAHGEILVFLDADYRVLPSFLARIAGRYADDASMAGAGVRVALEPTEIDPITRSIAAGALLVLRRTRSMSFGVASFRRECFDALRGYDESLYALEDVEILQRLASPRHRRLGRYRVLSDVCVLASARGFFRGGALGMGRMLAAYTRMTLFPAARRDIRRCGYWYERE
jgi:glycosyltransferase involved in cell wall biosynthesis